MEYHLSKARDRQATKGFLEKLWSLFYGLWGPKHFKPFNGLSVAVESIYYIKKKEHTMRIWYLFSISNILILSFFLIFQKFDDRLITFTEVKQNPESTMEKYRNIWGDNRILTKEKALKEYQYGEVIASITIPDLQFYEQNVYYGSDPINNNWRITSPGHIGNWGFVGEKTPTVIGAHNYQLFKDLPSLEIGDRFIVENEIDIYVFEVVNTFIYQASQQDWNEMYLNLEPYSLVLMTCYPLEVISSPDRYIVNTRMIRGTKIINK